MKALETSTSELRKLVPSDAALWCLPEIVVKPGDPAEQILGFAEEDATDLIVLGLPKNKEFSPYYRRGITYKVVSAAPSPVLTLRCPQ